MCNTSEERNVKVSIGGRTITNLRFADDIDVVAEEALVESLEPAQEIRCRSVPRKAN